MSKDSVCPPSSQLSNRSPDSVLSYRSCSSGCPITLDVENANWEPGDYVLFIYPNENNPSTNDYKAVISTTSLPISACAGAGTVYVYIYGGPAAAYVDVVDCQDANAQEFHLVNTGSGNINCSVQLNDCNSSCWTLSGCGGLSAH